MKKLILSASLFVIPLLTHAQQAKINDGNYTSVVRNNGDRFQFINSYDIREIETKGSRYFYDDNFHSGELWTTTGHYKDEMQYKFDQIEGTVLVKMTNGREMLLAEKDVLMFHYYVGDKKTIFIQSKIPNGKEFSLLQVVYLSPTLQLVRDSKKYIFRVKDNAENGYSKHETYDEIRNKYTYYASKGDKNPLEAIEITTKSFVRFMPSQRTKIVQFFKANKSKQELTLTKIAELMQNLDEKNTPSK